MSRTYTYDRRSKLGRLYAWWAGKAVSLGLAAGRMWGMEAGKHKSAIYWRGKRLSFLGIPRWKWRCVLKFHHWPTPYTVVFDFCGKCCPWPCCGSIGQEHAEGCTEADL